MEQEGIGSTMRYVARVEQRLAQGLLSVAVGCLPPVGPAALSLRRDSAPGTKPSSLALVCLERLTSGSRFWNKNW